MIFNNFFSDKMIFPEALFDLNYIFLIYFSKINQYSPSENVKVYEKAISRRHAPQFQPKATIAQLEEENVDEELDEHARRRLVDDYLEVILYELILCQAMT